jgi:hypothetical protein
MSAFRIAWGSRIAASAVRRALVVQASRVLPGLCLAFAGCVALPDPNSPREYLDPATAATIEVVGKPLVFAHEQTERAVHMRDYVTLAAAMVDRSGKIEYVLIGYFWTTLDTHGRSGADPKHEFADLAEAPLTILADGRQIELPLRSHSAAEAGIGAAVHAPPTGHAEPNVYRADLQTLRFLSAAREIVLVGNPTQPDSHYRIWDDGRRSLAAFVRHANGGRE